jgi:selenocysteine-specific elongation factor
VPVVGTAGHVDHGKSTLVQALTGRDPDRWEEEKRRGLTIDIGFAWTDLDEGREVSFVDVPGHERFLKNMLAGIEPIDIALLVVAADEGWMPQSEEHLAVLDLLGIDHGVVALTKVDLVDDDVVELATLEIGERLEGTTLEDSQIVSVSATSGRGLADLRAALGAALGPEPPPGSRPRLWIDRSFSVAGAGTVVTGTLLDGQLSIGDTLTVFPSRVSGRIRSLQSHERALTTATPRRRLAIGLTGLSRADAPRGAMVGMDDHWDLSDRFTCRLRTARYIDELPTKGAYHIHIGSGAHRAEIRRIENGIAMIGSSTHLPVRTGDRFIIRDTGRRLVVAGGIILDPDPGPLSTAIRAGRGIDPHAPPDEIADQLLRIRGSAALDRLAAHSGGGTPAGGVIVAGHALSRPEHEKLMEQAGSAVSRAHEAHPLRPGLPLATLATTLRQDVDVAELLVEASPRLEKIGPDVRLVGHSPVLRPADKEVWERARSLLARKLAVPRVDELGIEPELVHLLIRQGELVRVSEDLVILPAQAEEAMEAIKAMPGGFTVAQFRDATRLSRKYAVPILEWADDKGLTERRGDLRYLR